MKTKDILIFSLTLNCIMLIYIWNLRANLESLKLNSQEEALISLNDEQVDSIKTKAQNNILKRVFNNYHTIKRSVFEVMPPVKNGIVFLGNSITDNCDWNELLENPRVKNRGISGDKIEGIIDRLDEIIVSNPIKIFLMVGINDFRKKRTVGQILVDYERLVRQIREKSPATTLYIQSILPTKMKGYNNDDIIKANQGLKQLSVEYDCEYINLFDLFKGDNNEMNMDFSVEGIHLNGKGYLLWKDAIQEYIK